MNHKLIILLLLAFSLTATAKVSRGISFEASGALGYSQLGYAAAEQSDFSLKTKGNFGWNAHLGAELFFTRFVGVGVGVDVTQYAQANQLSGSQFWKGVTDTDGELYNHTLKINKLNENHHRLYVAPQVLLVGQIPMGPLKLHLGVGAEYALALSAGYSTKGNMTHTGFYPGTNVTLHDLNSHGFYTEGKYLNEGKLDKGKNMPVLVARADILIPLSDNLDLGAGILFKNALTHKEEAGGTQTAAFREDKTTVPDEVWKAHYFMNDYRAISTTSLTTGTYSPRLIAFNLSLRYTIPFKTPQRGKCLCEDY